MKRLFGISLIACVIAALAPGSTPAFGQSQGCEWLAGDFHVHTTYSGDSYGGPTDDPTDPQEFYTLGHSVSSQFAVAESRGLDFTAITDHNDVRSQSDPGFGSMGVIGVPGYENSIRGHAEMLGATEVYDTGDEQALAVNAMAEALRANGGVLQINHPYDGLTVDEPSWKYGFDVVPDTIEVWNISRIYQPPFPSGSNNDLGISYWEQWLDRGYRIAATGGSDNHYLATTAVQGVGQPTTWVCTPEASTAGILAGLEAGHTFVSHQPPTNQGPRLFIEADGDGDGTYEAIAGDLVPPGSPMRVLVEGAPGAQLRIATNGGAQVGDLVTVDGPAFEYRFDAPADSTWVRAEIAEPDARDERTQACDGIFGGQTTYCRNQLAALALTSAIFLGEENAGPAPTELVYDGTTHAKPGSTATLAATLASGGAPLAGRTVTFTFRDATYEATTDAAGHAAVSVKVNGPPGSFEVVARYAGETGFDPSTATARVEIRPGS